MITETRSTPLDLEKLDQLYARVLEQVRGGERSLENLFTPADREFLRSVGSKPVEIFDSADDFSRFGEPSWEEMKKVHQMRYDYFIMIQGGQWVDQVIELRPKNAELGGIPWLPRIKDKIQARLRGQLPDAFYYPCSGDRAFLQKVGFGISEFFKMVSETVTDEEVLEKIKSKR